MKSYIKGLSRDLQSSRLISSCYVIGLLLATISGCATKTMAPSPPTAEVSVESKPDPILAASPPQILESAVVTKPKSTLGAPSKFALGEKVVHPIKNGTILVAQEDVELKKMNIEKKQNIKYINLTPFTKYQDNWVNSSPSTQNGAIFSDTYTRLIITSDIRADGNNDEKTDNGEVVDEYPYKPRWWITRAIISKEFSINFTTKVIVNSFEETIPLVTIGHDSNSEGEKWSRVIRHSDQAHPLFLVKGNGNGAVPKITITMHGSQSFTSRGAANALGVVYSVANAISPTSSVITKLNTQSTKDRATALDSAISKLFGAAILEEHSLSSDLRLWNEDGGKPNGINVSLSIPYPDESWGDASNYKSAIKNKGLVGTWTVTFDYPRPSIFSDWRICGTENPKIRCAADKSSAKSKVLGEIDAGEVLAYVLDGKPDSQYTIRAYLAQQEWFSQGQTKLVRAKSQTTSSTDAVKVAANQMCRNIHSAITGLDLSGFDAEIVVWAIFKGLAMPDGSPSFDNVAVAEDCKHAIQRIQNAKSSTN